MNVALYGPKTLQRVLRFRRFVSRIDACPDILDLATLAAEAGYADQAHLTRVMQQAFWPDSSRAGQAARLRLASAGQRLACQERIAGTTSGAAAVTDAIRAR
jgi:hypothetical protein